MNFQTSNERKEEKKKDENGIFYTYAQICLFPPSTEIKDSDKKDLDICLAVLTFLPMQKILQPLQKKV